MWRVVEESNDDSGNPTCWSREINSDRYGKYVWISKFGEDAYAVEVESGGYGYIQGLKICKSLASAKRWVTMNLV